MVEKQSMTNIPLIALKEITKILKLILNLTGNQCKERKTGVI